MVLRPSIDCLNYNSNFGKMRSPRGLKDIFRNLKSSGEFDIKGSLRQSRVVSEAKICPEDFGKYSDAEGSEVILKTKQIDESKDSKSRYPLTKSEAYFFVQSILKIPYPKAMFQKDPETLLTSLAERLKYTTPYTNIHFFHEPFPAPDQRGKEHMLTGQGGTCLDINPFTKSLLEFLGYTTTSVIASTLDLRYSNSHIGTVVRDAVYPGSLHLIEPGTRNPIFQPISLDFTDESPIYRGHHLQNKFFKSKDEDKLIWCTKPSKEMMRDLQDFQILLDKKGKPWQIHLIYDLLGRNNPRKIFNDYLTNVARHQATFPPGLGHFVYNAFDGNRIVNMTGKMGKIVAKVFDRGGLCQQNKMSPEEFVEFFGKSFPQYSNQMMMNVLKANFQL